MENVLIISSSKGAAEQLAGFIRDYFHSSVKAVETAYQAKTLISNDLSAELAVINAPLSDESGVELAEYIAETTAAGCIIIVKAETAGNITDRLEKSGVIVVTRPFSKTMLYQMIKTVDIAARRSLRIYEKALQLEQKIEELRIIDKAKFMLMEYRNMNESEAHSYIEQYAMNKRKKKKIAALELIDKLNEQYL